MRNRESRRRMRTKQHSLTRSIDSGRSYPSVVFASAKNLIQDLLLLLAEVYICIVGTKNRMHRISVTCPSIVSFRDTREERQMSVLPSSTYSRILTEMHYRGRQSRKSPRRGIRPFWLRRKFVNLFSLEKKQSNWVKLLQSRNL